MVINPVETTRVSGRKHIQERMHGHAHLLRDPPARETGAERMEADLRYIEEVLTVHSHGKFLILIAEGTEEAGAINMLGDALKMGISNELCQGK